MQTQRNVIFQGSLLLLMVAVFLAPVYAQRRTTKRPAAQSEQQQPVSFDTLLSVDSYKIYGEVRGVGQLIRSEGAKDLLDPVMKLAAPPKEFRSLVKWLNARADPLTASRLLFAAWPSRPKLPQVLVALEFPSPEEAQKFEPQLKEFLPKLLPAPTPESSPSANQGRGEESKRTQKPSPPPYVLKQSGSLVFITSAPFAFNDLKPRGSKVLAEDQNFRVAHSRFNSESLFLYVDFAAINKEETEQRRKGEEEYKRIQAEATQQAKSEAAANTSAAEMPAPQIILPSATPPNADPPPDSPQLVAQLGEAKPEQPNLLDSAFFSLSGVFFGGRPKWPEGIGVSLVFDGDSYVVRVLLLNSTDERSSPIPFFPQLAPGPALVPESPSVLPADTELFIAASLDFQQVYEGMLDSAKAQFEEMKKYRPQSVNLEPESPFEAYEKRLGIKVKEDLLHLLGNEVAFTVPMKAFNVGPFSPEPSPAKSAAPDEKEKPVETQGPSPIFAVSVKDREAVKALIPRILDSLGLKAASMLATTEKREDTELISYANIVSYAFIGNFLVGSTDVKAVRHVVDSYLNHETLASSTHFRNYTRWQPRQVLGQVYVSPALMDSYNLFARSGSAQISDQLRDFLVLLSPVPQAVTYAISNEGVGPLHELHIPKNLVMLMVAGMSAEPGESHIYRNEAVVQRVMRTLASAEATYHSTEGAGRFGTLDELTQAGMVSKDLLQNSGYKIELIVSNSRFEISAVPTEYGKTGKRSFFLDESSVLRAADHGGGAATIADKPAQ
jgi:hypothetical protein